MTPPAWHADEALLRAYGDGAVDDARALSVEMHLIGCEACRTGLGSAMAGEPAPPATSGAARTADRGTLGAVWAGIVDEVDRPKRSWGERVLSALGVPGATARLIGVTPTLRASWLASCATVVAFVYLMSASRLHVVFLTLAPLIPLVSVAASFGASDPTRELMVSTPMSEARLLLLRAMAVVVTSAGLCGIGAAGLVPALGWQSAAWLLPAIALISLALAFGTLVPIEFAAAGLAAAWVMVVVLAAVSEREALAAFEIPGQLLAAAAAAAAIAVVVVRREQVIGGPSL